MQFAATEPRTFQGFLDKFKILDNIPWTTRLIERKIIDVCEGFKRDRLDYVWLRFSVNKYLTNIDWGSMDAIRFIKQCFDQHSPCPVGLFLSLKYESGREQQRTYAKLVERSAIADMLAGIDLVGDEKFFDSQFYAALFDDWVKAKKVVCAHVGESCTSHNVAEAIKIGARQISHGIHAHDDEYVIKMAKEYDVGYDLALTSNYLTGVWTDPDWHPVRNLLDAGLDVTIGTDDPTQCDTTLDKEFEGLQRLGFSADECQQLRLNAVGRSVHHGLFAADVVRYDGKWTISQQ